MDNQNKKQDKKIIKKDPPKKEAVLTKSDFFKSLDKVIEVVKKNCHRRERKKIGT